MLNGNAAPVPKGAMAIKKMIPPIQDNFTIIPLAKKPSAINNCPAAIKDTYPVMCFENAP